MNMMQKILIVEDESHISNFIAAALKSGGYVPILAENGREAKSILTANGPDLMLLDLGLPDMDGLDLIRYAREWSRIPIVVVSARMHEQDKVEALDAGADDYLAKPFAMGEFLARVRALLRRREGYTPDVMTMGNVSLNIATYELSTEEKTFSLSKIEYQLMELLMLNKGIYLSTDDLLTKVWGYETEAELGIVWVYISYLRKKLEKLESRAVIASKRGIGYALEEVKTG